MSFTPLPSSRTIANGTANDATVVQANFTDLFNNDAGIAAVANAAWATANIPFVKGTTGYITLPNGLLIQWGTVSVPGNSNPYGFNFPIAFPTNTFAMFAGVTSSAGAQPLSYGFANLASGAIYNYNSNTLGVTWLALGN